VLSLEKEIEIVVVAGIVSEYKVSDDEFEVVDELDDDDDNNDDETEESESEWVSEF